MNKQHI